LVIAFTAGTLLSLVGPVRAAAPDALAPYPTRPIRMIVASSPGTASDYFARVISEQLAAAYRQQIVVDNRAGAGGLIGNAIISKANPDGHTLAMVGVTRIISELIRPDAPYDALNDIAGVAHVATITNVLASAAALPVHTVSELIAYARARPGDLNYASVGIGSSSHLAAELFTRSAGLNVVHVPFRSLTDAFVEMHLGRVHYSVFTVPGAMPFLREGKLRALAVTTPARSAALPDVPTMAEAGLPEARFENWSGIVAPAGTPRRVVEQLHGDIIHILRGRDVREQFSRQGAVPMVDSTPDGFMRLMRLEYLRYERLVREAGITAQ
jgi:Uncharacterized protein conserved in bacteria